MNASQAVALHDLLQSIANGDQNAVSRTGITADNARRLLSLQTRELSALLQSNAAFINFEIDNAVLDLLLQNIAGSRSQQQMIQALIEADAPLDMVRHYYPQMQRTQYGLQRRLAGMHPAPQGRTRSPDEALEMAIATAWYQHVTDQEHPAPADYLQVHQASNAPIRQIWAMHKPHDYGPEK